MTQQDLEDIDFLIDDDEIVEGSQNENHKFEHYRFVADKGQSMLRIDKFLSVRIEGISRNRIQIGRASCRERV